MKNKIGSNREKKEMSNNFPSVIQNQNETNEKLKSILIKVTPQMHKELMQNKVDTGITINDFIVNAIDNYLKNK